MLTGRLRPAPCWRPADVTKAATSCVEPCCAAHSASSARSMASTSPSSPSPSLLSLLAERVLRALDGRLPLDFRDRPLPARGAEPRGGVAPRASDIFGATSDERPRHTSR